MLRPSYPQIYRQSQMPDTYEVLEKVRIVDGTWEVGDMVDWFRKGCYWSAQITEAMRKMLRFKYQNLHRGKEKLVELFAKIYTHPWNASQSTVGLFSSLRGDPNGPVHSPINNNHDHPSSTQWNNCLAAEGETRNFGHALQPSQIGSNLVRLVIMFMNNIITLVVRPGI